TLDEAGVAVAGYVDTDYGQRTDRAIRTDVDRYRSWYPQVRAAFCARVSAGEELVARYRRVARTTRAAGMGTVVFNHGVHPVPGYAEHADLLGTFEGPCSADRTPHGPPSA